MSYKNDMVLGGAVFEIVRRARKLDEFLRDGKLEDLTLYLDAIQHAAVSGGYRLNDIRFGKNKLSDGCGK